MLGQLWSTGFVYYLTDFSLGETFTESKQSSTKYMGEDWYGWVLLWAHYTCMAGLGEVCSHVIAIVFYIDANYRIKTCTEVPCRAGQYFNKLPISPDQVPVIQLLHAFSLRNIIA